MAMRTHWMRLVAGAGAWLLIAAAPAIALAQGGGNCGCGGGGQGQHHHYPHGQSTHVHVNTNINVNVKVNTATQTQLNSQLGVRNFANVGALVGTSAEVAGGSGAANSYAGPGAVSETNLNLGGAEREAYEATRTRFEKVVIEAFCFDDKDVPHPASQVTPDRDIDEAYEGEVYRCIAGAHMQVTIAPWSDHVSFTGGRTIACRKGEALYHMPGKGGGLLMCRTQIPERDCNERSLLRRFGAGVKVLTLLVTEKYTAYREESHESAGGSLSLDGGVGGVVF